MDNYVSQFHPSHIGLAKIYPSKVRIFIKTYTVGKRILSGIVRAVNKIIAFKAIEINQIPITDKNNPKEDGNSHISGFALLVNIFLPLQQLCISLSFAATVDVSQFRISSSYKYTSPG
ncbi:MAG: hypothetical protein ACLT8I_23640 [Blautia faecis]